MLPTTIVLHLARAGAWQDHARRDGQRVCKLRCIALRRGAALVAPICGPIGGAQNLSAAPCPSPVHPARRCQRPIRSPSHTVALHAARMDQAAGDAVHAALAAADPAAAAAAAVQTALLSEAAAEQRLVALLRAHGKLIDLLETLNTTGRLELVRLLRPKPPLIREPLHPAHHPCLRPLQPGNPKGNYSNALHWALGPHGAYVSCDDSVRHAYKRTSREFQALRALCLQYLELCTARLMALQAGGSAQLERLGLRQAAYVALAASPGIYTLKHLYTAHELVGLATAHAPGLPRRPVLTPPSSHCLAFACPAADHCFPVPPMGLWLHNGGSWHGRSVCPRAVPLPSAGALPHMCAADALATVCLPVSHCSPHVPKCSAAQAVIGVGLNRFFTLPTYPDLARLEVRGQPGGCLARQVMCPDGAPLLNPAFQVGPGIKAVLVLEKESIQPGALRFGERMAELGLPVLVFGGKGAPRILARFVALAALR